MNDNHDSTASTADIFNYTAQFGVGKYKSKLLGLRAIETYCRKLPADEGLAACVDQVIIDQGLPIDHIKAAAHCIPKTGPLLITANHPTGILDGAVLLCALLSIRSDIRILSNQLLSGIPVLGGYVIPVDKSNRGEPDGHRILLNIRRNWKHNRCIVVFPAGTVSHWQWKSMKISDAPWTTTIQDLAAAQSVTEYRAKIELKNPSWFHLCAAISRDARVALLLRAFLSNRNHKKSYPVKFADLKRAEA